MELTEKHRSVIQYLREHVAMGNLAVAFSGGVDSTLLLALALEALGPERVVAVTARSESLAQAELEACRRLSKALGARLIELQTHELEKPGYRANSGERCYYCKSELFDAVDFEVRKQEGVVAVAYGATVDDLSDHRPGMKAAREHAVLAPLADAGFTKAEIRELSKQLGLETWDKPAHPCLASRIAYGQEVTAQKLTQVERAEALLRELGLRELRVRHHESFARIEVPVSDLPRLLEEDVRERVVTELRGLGFQYVVLDLEGFRSGRLNEALTKDRRLPQAVL